MTPNELKSFIQATFQNVVEDLDAPQDIYAKYFSQDYIQRVDNEEFGFTGFVDHMKALKQATASIKIIFHHLIAEGNQVCSVHTAHAIKKNGAEVKMKVIAYMRVVDNKIVFCEELTQLLKGDSSDRDLGSRR